MKVFIFTDEQIEFVQGIQRRGQVSDPELEQVKNIYETVLGTKQSFCSTCGDAIKASVNRLIQITEETIGMSLKKWSPEPVELKDDFQEGLKEGHWVEEAGPINVADVEKITLPEARPPGNLMQDIINPPPLQAALEGIKEDLKTMTNKEIKRLVYDETGTKIHGNKAKLIKLAIEKLKL